MKLTSGAGRRRELIGMTGGEDSQTVAGCLSFIVAEDAGDEDVLWITEVWESEASHQASLEAPAAKESFQDADTLIVGFEKVAETRVVEGVEWAVACTFNPLICAGTGAASAGSS